MEKREIAMQLLRDKAAAMGAGCLPRKQDFAQEEVVLIKQALGPWPRALEAAGLKEPRGVDRKADNRRKRKRIHMKYKTSPAMDKN